MKVGFISDLRSVISGHVPLDADFMYNDALHIITLKILKPDISMLKFHPPYMKDGESLEKYSDVISPYLNRVRDQYGLDMIKLYKQGIYKSICSSEVYLQAWSGANSSEARQIVHKTDIDKPFQHYDHVDWDDRLTYQKLIRGYGYHPDLIQALSKYKHTNEHIYDGCFDCSLEMLILFNYIIKPKCHMNLENIVMRIDSKVCDRFISLMNMIEKSANWERGLANCIHRSKIYRPLSSLNFFMLGIINDDNKIIVFKIDKYRNIKQLVMVDCVTKKITGDLSQLSILSDDNQHSNKMKYISRRDDNKINAMKESILRACNIIDKK